MKPRHFLRSEFLLFSLFFSCAVSLLVQGCGPRNDHGETSTDGEKYMGEWKDGEWDGKETLTFPHGVKYVGEFKNGVPNGHGTWTFPNGAKYVGGFKDSKFNGQATMTWPDGKKETRKFKDGKIVSQ